MRELREGQYTNNYGRKTGKRGKEKVYKR